MVYLDYAATTPVRQEVIDVIQDSLAQEFGNPSAIYQLGKTAKHSLMQARQPMAACLNVSAKSLYFTSGATEANNWAIRSQAYQARHLGFGHHIVSSSIEHPSVMEVCHQLEHEGFEVSYVSPNEDGQIIPEAYQAASIDQTIGWICMAVNNEVGSIMPIEAMGRLAQEKGYWFHVDTVQALGQEGWESVAEWCTSFVGSGHKFYAPKGIGFLVYQAWNPEMTLSPLIRGGGQESKMRSGTENLPYIKGLAKAFELAYQEAFSKAQHFDQLSSYLYQELDKVGIAYQRNGNPQAQVPYIHSIWLPGQLASQVLIQMDLNQIYISAGSACSAGSVVDSKILKAYYPQQADRWRQSIRLSFGRQTTQAEIDLFIQQLIQLKERKQDLWHSHKKQL